MRRPEYISPSSMKKFFENIEEWYVRYLSDYKIPRDPQTRAMSIGSAFDAFVKSYLHERLFGKGSDPDYELDSLFEKQVEAHNRDWARVNGEYAFKFYQSCGALADLLLELDHAVGQPKFEIEILNYVGTGTSKSCPNGIMLLGKPDVFFRNRMGKIVILDWKVNGWCGKGNTSPAKGYIRTRDSVGSGKAHKDCLMTEYQGMVINQALHLEEANEEWAAQLATYGWLCGADIGEEFITCIDQFACKNVGGQFPQIRVAEHRTTVSKEFQEACFERYAQVQRAIDTGHIFTDMSLEDSKGRCEILDMKAKSIAEAIEAGTPVNMAISQSLG